MKLVGLKKCFLLPVIYFFNVGIVVALERNVKETDKVLSDPIGVSHFFQMFLGLFLVIVLIFGLAWLIKRINHFQGSMNNVLKVLSIISVGQKEKVVLIQVGEKQLLIGVSPGNVNTLLVLDEAVKENISKSEVSGFSEKLAMVLKGKLG